ncbi:hypothetical protein K458DRAFT_399951 [Lentithecium fluviatile CBS 122367]|uniref:Uncharacterized protein n=1 Tax=Lentithecium fluviatile CBS 122367 TaxID=1168545 RepID=A0A6G1JG70_9PLEO|nr:hypothetical protein K458DRAFT_399951 [Lentithecium fluviatile CBS 122367]
MQFTRLNVDEVHALESANVLSASNTANKRKVSDAMLTSRSSNTSTSSSLCSASSSQTVYISVSPSKLPANLAMDFPLNTENAETLEFMRFTAKAALQTFSRYSSRPDPNAEDVLPFALGHVARLKIQPTHVTDEEALVQVGLNDKTTSAILDLVHR